MKIYIELVFIVNFLLDFIILYGTKKLLKLNKSNKRLLLASIIGSLSTIIIFLKITNIILIILKILLSLILIIVSFGKSNILINTFYFYLISIIVGGTIYLFDLNKNLYFNYLILIILSPIIIYLLIKELNKHRLNINDKYLVEITISKKKYKLEGFIDTGNRLSSPIKKEPVILVNLKINYNKVIYIPYKALNTEGIIPCIKPDKIMINNKQIKNYLVGLAADKFTIDNVNCILPNKLKEDLWKTY